MTLGPSNQSSSRSRSAPGRIAIRMPRPHWPRRPSRGWNAWRRERRSCICTCLSFRCPRRWLLISTFRVSSRGWLRIRTCWCCRPMGSGTRSRSGSPISSRWPKRGRCGWRSSIRERRFSVGRVRTGRRRMTVTSTRSTTTRCRTRSTRRSVAGSGCISRSSNLGGCATFSRIGGPAGCRMAHS